MRLSDFAFMPYSEDRDDYLDHIAEAAIEEDWGQDRRHLRTYVADNFEIAYAQGKVKEDQEGRYALWRVGTLTTHQGEPITVLAVRNRRPGKQPYFYRCTFSRERFTVKLLELEEDEITETAPPPPAYEIPEYAAEYKLTYNFAHYLEDHEERVAEKFPNLTPHQRFLCIYAALTLAHKRGEQAAVPQWYHDKNAEEGSYQALLHSCG